MAEAQLKTTTGGGTQTATGSPQLAGQAANSGTKTSSLQPGTENKLLTSNPQGQGVPLAGQVVTTIDMGVRTDQGTTATAAVALPEPTYQINGGLVVIPTVLIVVAAALFWLTKRSAKTTTEY